MAQAETPNTIEQVIWEAIQREVGLRPEAFLFNAYDWELSQVTFSEDQTSAVVWLDPLDQETGTMIASEPLSVIVFLAPGGDPMDSSDWQVVFQDDQAWKNAEPKMLDLLPKELTVHVTENLKEPKAPGTALGGYKLPWAAGAAKNLTWSAEHRSCGGSYCVYALDFADRTMFPLLAAKGGTVFAARDSCANGVTDCTNLIILKDVSTNPTSYQIYYHLANGSIPAALHTIGTAVSQGQYIGNVDDTGYSSGNHLHFMVHINPYGYWGASVDITFQDVSINWDAATRGGRPRTQAGAAILGGQWQTSYISGNVGTNPPTGGLTLPADKQTVTGKTLATAGWGRDNLGITRLQLLAYYSDSWHEVGIPQTANPFNYNLDMCNAGIPIGPFDLALRVWDVEGNQTPSPLTVRHLINAVGCASQTTPVLNSDMIAPSLSMIYPTEEDGVPAGPTSFSVTAQDAGSGVKRVEFWWHSPDWVYGQWQLLAKDTKAGDGWSAPFDGSGYSEEQKGALLVISYDKKENANLVVQWFVPIDKTPPITNLDSLPATTDGTGILLSWRALDTRSRLAGFEIQYQMDGGSWQTWQVNISGSRRSTWFIGQPGKTYGFRMRGRDTSGNWETYATSAEITSKTALTCGVDAYDRGAGDSVSVRAVSLQPGIYQKHNFCGVGDVDWSSFYAQAGQEYLMMALPESGSPASSKLDLYQFNESVWLLHTEALGTGGPLSLRWTAPADGWYLIRLAPLDDHISGNTATYSLRVGKGWWSILSIISR
jgi:murein DD-endopeptidase MepM/ murein hydrolase activator NlpD